MKKLWPYFRTYRWQALAAMGLILVQSFADLFLPRLMADIVDNGIAAGDTREMLRVGGFMLLVALGGAAAAVAAVRFASGAALGFGRDLRRAVFAKTEGFSLAEFDRFGASTLITRATNDVTQLQGTAQMSLHMLTRAPLMAVGSLAMALATDARLTLILLAALPFMAALVVLVGKRGVPLFRKAQKKTDALNRVLRESLAGVRVVRAFDREEAERRRYAEANAELTDTSLKAQRTVAVMMPAMMALMNFTSVAVVWFGGRQAVSGDLRVGDLMAFLQYAMHILFSLMILSQMFVMLPRAAVCADRVSEILAAAPTVEDAPGAGAPRAVPGAPRLEFRGVSFRYPGAEELALEGISFSAEAGKTTAIIGGTGAGKSTLLYLAERFYDAADGAVLLDGVDVRSYSQAELRSRLGLAPQKATLFSGSVADNLRFGKTDADSAELASAARTAQAASFVEALDGGYDAPVARGGATFSGGQKQRLSVARALARPASVYLFDDSFSALDFRTDARLRAALKERLARENPGAALVIVAQRVGTVMDADRIVVLDEGRVAGVGTHGELLESCPAYRELVESQLTAEERA